MSNSFVRYLLEGNNYPSNGQVVFDSSDHIRFQNGQDISGHNYGCNRRLVIKKNIQGEEGYRRLQDIRQQGRVLCPICAFRRDCYDE